MRLKEAYQSGKRKLSKAGVESAAFDASCLFAHCFGMERSRLPLCGEEEADSAVWDRYELLLDRRAAGEPLQYLLGEWEFMGLPVLVGEGVLIPRDDTEVLVRTAARLLGQTERPKILDLCAGSGAVGIALSRLYYPEGDVVSLELSEEAFSYLQKNIARNRTVRVTPVRGDALAGPKKNEREAYDALLSNPPYIPTGDLPSLQAEVQREPALALDGGTDGLRFYRAIASLWVPAVRPGGIVAVEIGIGQAKAVCALWEQAGLRDICVERDIAGIERVVAGRKPAGAG